MSREPAAAWARVLDDLDEMAAAAGEHADDAAVARLVAWTPPEDLGPLPETLAERALAVADRMASTVERLHRAIRSNRRHARAVTVVTGTTGDRSAAYLDVCA